MTEKDKGTNERLTLEITEALEPKDIGKDRPWMMLEFRAKVIKRPEKSLMADDKPHTFKAFSEKLFEYIKEGMTIECDVNISTAEKGDQVFINRKVTQIYEDGQPVNVKQQGGRSWGKSPEMILAEIDSKFRNTALMQAVEFSKHTEGETTKPEDILDIADRFYGWLTSGKAPNAPQPSPETRQTAPKEKAEGLDLRSLEIKNLGDLFTACLKHFKLNQAAVLKELGGITKVQIADPKDSWLQIVASRE